MGKIKRKISENLELPQEVFGDVSTVTVKSNNEITVTSCKSILKYEEEELYMQLSDITLKIFGHDLILKTYFGNNIYITGDFYRIEFEV